MTGKGFRGGAARQYTGASGSSGYQNNDFRNVASPTTTGAHGSKGEGWAGTPRFVSGMAHSATDTSVEGYLNGSVGRGAPGNAGGGATDNKRASNTGNAGGGGGGNAGNGGRGGFNRGANSGARASGGGKFAGTIERWFLGGGGGAGSTEEAGTLSSGAPGGGIVVLRTGYLSGTGELRANGGNAPTAGQTENYTNGGGGGGAGGTVVLLATNTTGVANMTLSAVGGTGGNALTGVDADDYGPGGGGGGGFVFANSDSGTKLAAGGANGLTEMGRETDTNDAEPGEASAVPTNASEPSVLIGGAGGCLPSLSVAMSTSTPNVQRTGGTGSSVNPAVYTLTISNTGGQADNVNILTSLPSNIFQFDPTFTPIVQLQRADGTTTTITTTVPTSEVSTPEFGDANLSIPAGATLLVTFQATIAAEAQNGFAYQANAAVTYSNPFRTTDPATITIGPGGNYAGGTVATLGAAGGSNYSASSSTNEDVTITRPLPVTLASFEARAAGRDAVLTWETATELHNDHFDVERSFDGVTFETIGSRQGQGSTSRASAYRFADAGAARFPAKVLYYRLHQVDEDGSGSHSSVRTVRFERQKATAGLYPNPQQGQFTLDLLELPAGTYQVDILDLAGRHVLRTQRSGGQQHPIQVPDLPMGSYIVRVSGQTVNITLPMTRN